MKLDQEALKARAVTIYNDFTVGQRVMVIVSTMLLMFGGMTFMRWAAAPSWAPLYTNLEAQDAAEVTSELDAMGITYKLSDSGSTIMVPRQHVYETRIDLSAQGLPRVGRDGWNLIDEQGLTTSEFRQRIDLQRAMEGELARTIASMDGVDAATVHLVMPEDDLFSGDDVHPSASVLLDPAGTGKMSSAQVQAIVHQIASSVEGMTPEFVTVTDTSGRLLSAPGQDGVDLAAGEHRIAQKNAFEANVASSIRTLLEPVVGVGNIRVAVSADLDFDQKERLSESFSDPDTAPVVSEDTTTETYTNGDNVVGGVLGPDALPVEEGEGADSEYIREDVTRSYAVGKVTEQIKASPGAVERLSVAVLVDEAAGINTAEINSLVVAAAGLVPARGDTIEVTAMAFGDAVPVDPALGTTSTLPADDMVMTLARSGAVVVLVLIVLFLAYRSARKSSLAKYPVAIPLPAEAAEETAALLAELDRELESADVLSLEPAEPPRTAILQEQIGELIDAQPEEVATVLRTWLADRRM